jgi:hypothetical protein
MTGSDRTVFDPFAPQPPPDRGPGQLPEPPAHTTDTTVDGLDELLKADLMDLAGRRGLSTHGTKADLIERLRAQ